MIAHMDKNNDNQVNFDEFLEGMLKAREMTFEEQIETSFKMFDKNNDGHISRKELRDIMESLGEQMSEEEIDAMIKEADTNNDGKINLQGNFSV